MIAAEGRVSVAVGLRGPEILGGADLPVVLTGLERGKRLRIALGGLRIDEIGDVTARREGLRASELLTDALTLHDQPLNDRTSDLVVPLQCDIGHALDLLG